MIDMENSPSVDLSKEGSMKDLKTDLDKRRGRFKIHSDLVEKEAQDFLTHLSPYIVVVGVKKDVFANMYEFMAYSPLFDIVKEYESIPEYMFTVTRTKENKFITEATRG